jgi:ABC-type sugar transport system ATPase subunit
VSAIKLDTITKIYANGVKAVDQVTLEIGDGEFVVLVGPSGCGKSTMLRMIAGLEEVTAGAIFSRSSATSRWSSRTTRSTRT